MKKTFFLFSFLFLSFSLFAQKGTVKGRVFDEKNNEPLQYAKVVIQGTSVGVVTDSLGRFSFQNIEPNFYRLEVRHVGYERKISSEIQVQGNQTTFIDIAVNHNSKLLNTVVFKRKLNVKKIDSPLSVMQVGVKEIEKTAGVNRDVSKLAQTLPGVGITDPNRNDLIVRGGGPSENRFYLDGIEIPIINHFTTQGSSGGAVGIINPDFVRDLTFYTGAFPAHRPNALSSVMEINQRDGKKDGFHTKVSVGASDAGITMEGPLGKKSTFIASARQSYLQFLFSAIGLPFLPTYNDFQFKYKVELDKKNQISLIGIGAIDKMRLNLEMKNPNESQRYILNYLPEFDQWNYTVGVVYKHFADTHYDTWVLSRNMLRNKNSKYAGNNTNLPKILDYNSDETENKFRFERYLPDGFFQVRFGAGAKHARYINDSYQLFFANGQVETLEYNTNLHLFFYETFLQLSKKLLDNRFQFSFGINTVGNNFNKNMANPLNQLSPRISATYSVTDWWNINVNAGRYASAPAYTTLGFKNQNDELVNKNEKLKYIISNQAIGGLEFLLNNKLRFTAEGFYKNYQNYPFSIADGLTIASKGTEYGQVGDEQVVSTGKGRAYGVEFLLKIMNWENLNLSSTYTLFKSEFTNKSGAYVPSTWDTRHLFNVMGSYQFLKNWNFAFRWRWLGGAPYSPIDEKLSTLRANWDIKHRATLDYQRYNSLRLPSSHQLDIRIDKEFYFKKYVLNLYADVQNVYNFKSTNVPIYTVLDDAGTPKIDPNDNSRYLLRQVNYFSGTVLPTVGISVKF